MTSQSPGHALNRYKYFNFQTSFLIFVLQCLKFNIIRVSYYPFQTQKPKFSTPRFWHHLPGT
ncbi:hypothetical protein BDZ94DRAFT_528593 [Collybia nuda]|uniref:Uncharacterized protein n=1 Tax=Collybia nuda TaxID=64659 RepID=A0A9P6CFK3_9AGAR|nr:hypothetical protein BDZ94DRAFT_528593 [Collybia nuda]